MKVSELFEDKERSILSFYGEQQKHNVTGFDCSGKRITSLKGAPETVHGGFYCFENELKSLEFAPKKVTGIFDCCENHITSLEGAPSFIGENFYCIDNKLESLHNIHKHIKYIGKVANFQGNPLKSHVLGLLMIEGLDYVILGSNNPLMGVESIINKHLKAGRDIFACQEELIESGYEDFAKL